MSTANWKLTATTIYCEAVDDEVTLLVYEDLSTKCVGYNRYGEPGKEAANLLRKKSKQSGRKLKCTGPECSRVIQYRTKISAEKTERGQE